MIFCNFVKVMDTSPTFRFKTFAVTDRRCAMKVGTDGVLLGAWAGIGDVPVRTVLDAGAGCGVISLMLAQRFGDATVTAVEIEHGAFADLCHNISEWNGGRIIAVEGSFGEVDGLFDLIVSNPPFFTNGESSPESQRALARHAGELSPLSLVDYAVGHLAPGGRLSMIVPVEIASQVIAHAAINRLRLCRHTDVVTSRRRGVTRSLLEFSNSAGPLASPNTVAVGSEEYTNLVKDFYIHL